MFPYIIEIFPVTGPLIVILITAGILFLVIIILYNLTNPLAIKIKYYLKFPFRSLAANPQISGFFRSLEKKLRSADFSIIKNSITITGIFIKKFALIIYKFETIYLHSFLRNLEEFISFAGLVSRKIHDGNTKIYTAYILGFIVLFYFILRTV